MARKTAVSQARLRKILESRGIRGGVVVGHIGDKKLPPAFGEIWKIFKFVAAGTMPFSPCGSDGNSTEYSN